MTESLNLSLFGQQPGSGDVQRHGQPFEGNVTAEKYMPTQLKMYSQNQPR